MNEKILSVKHNKDDWGKTHQSVMSLLKEVIHSSIISSCKKQSQIEIRIIYLKKKSLIKIHTNSEVKRSFSLQENNKITENINKSIKLTEVELESRVTTITNALSPLIKEMFLSQYKVDKRSLIDSEISFYLKNGEMSSIKEINYRYNQTCKFPPAKSY